MFLLLRYKMMLLTQDCQSALVDELGMIRIVRE
jgi:hypothetical protein